MKLLSGLIIGFIVGVLATIGAFELMRGDLASLAGRPPTAAAPASAATAPSSEAPGSATPSAGGGNAGTPAKTTP